MVTARTKDGKTVFSCDACKMLYPTKELAHSCEDWCRKNSSCNIGIIKHAIKP